MSDNMDRIIEKISKMLAMANDSSSLNDCRVLRQRGKYDTNMSFMFQGFKADIEIYRSSKAQ